MESLQAGSVVLIAAIILFALVSLFRAALFEEGALPLYLRATAAGFASSLVLFAIMMLMVNGLGAAPFNMAPSAAFLETLGWNYGGLAPVSHFVYGVVWALILVAGFGRDVTMAKAVGVAVGAQWLLFMLIYAPAMGWGFFGLGGPAQSMAAQAPLHLGSPVKFLVMTLVLHIVYGAINGWLIPRRGAAGEALAG